MKLFFLVTFLSLSRALSAQSASQFVKDNAKEIKDLAQLDRNIYAQIKDYDVILMGEMHGTCQPAAFVLGLAKLVAEMEHSVSVGIEIPASQMNIFLENPSDSSLAKSEFFMQKNVDGRNGKAWYDLIKNTYKLKNLHLFFIDNQFIENRDSFMYETVKSQRSRFPKDKIITLSGNIHSMLIPFRNTQTMGSYMVNDSLNFSKNRIMSIQHFYKEGTMLNNQGNGLALQTVNNPDNFFNNSVPFDKYFMPSIFVQQKQYSHILFTRKVSHSE